MRRKAKPNPVDPTERNHVLNRDRECIIAKLVGLGRIPAADVRPCHDVWGQPIRAWSFETLEYNHVKPAAGMGGARPMGRRWAVAACHGCNGDTVQVSKFVAAIRDYLAELEATGRL